jgi:hypothetical protein
VAYETLRWFARGGAHANHYMFGGGYNYGRSAAGGIANTYAADAPLCSSGEPRRPKYDRLAALHRALAGASATLLQCPTALRQNRSALVWNGTGWRDGGPDAPVFRYAYEGSCGGRNNSHDSNRSSSASDCRREVVFVENPSDQERVVRVRVVSGRRRVAMAPRSSVMFVDGAARFDSGRLPARSRAYARRTVTDPAPLVDWAYWPEPVGAGMDVGIGTSSSSSLPGAVVAARPVEQTALIVGAGVSTDYAWYEVDFAIPRTINDWAKNGTIASAATLVIETQQANGMVAYVDGIRAGDADTHHHKEGGATLSIPLPPRVVRELVPAFAGAAAAGTARDLSPALPPADPSFLGRRRHRLSILSESFGHGNLIGCFGVNNTRAKTKGITGRVRLVLEKARGAGVEPGSRRRAVELVDGKRLWRSTPGLRSGGGVTSEAGRASGAGGGAPGDEAGGGLWSSARFVAPEYDPERQALFVEIASGRGHLWLNGIDLGRYWNLTANGRWSADGVKRQTQRYYFLPPDLLLPRGGSTPSPTPDRGEAQAPANELKLFDALGGARRPPSPSSRPRLVLSWVEPVVPAAAAAESRGRRGAAPSGFADRVGFEDACLY